MSGYEIGQLVAFVTTKTERTSAPKGTILGATGAFVLEVEENGDALEDHDVAPFDFPSRGGLYVLDGFVHVSAGPDPDVQLLGEWRKLTHWELVRLADGIMPWENPALEKGI